MLHKLLQRLQIRRNHPAEPPADGFRRGEQLTLPLGAIIAEQGVRLLRQSNQRNVEPVLDEAYVVMRLYDQSCWYATWEPYAMGWSVLRLDAEAEAPANDASFPAPAMDKFSVG